MIYVIRINKQSVVKYVITEAINNMTKEVHLFYWYYSISQVQNNEQAVVSWISGSLSSHFFLSVI